MARYSPAAKASPVERADALDHLGRAVAMIEQFRGLAKDDPGLAAIRDDPAFEDLTGG